MLRRMTRRAKQPQIRQRVRPAARAMEDVMHMRPRDVRPVLPQHQPPRRPPALFTTAERAIEHLQPSPLPVRRIARPAAKEPFAQALEERHAEGFYVE